MKKFITQEQINELKPTARKQLVTWWYKKRHQYDDFDADGYEIKEPLMSIAHMIEFLDEHLDGCVIDMTIWKGKVDGNAYLTGYTLSTNPPIKFCDALWGRVKDILEN
jgi:hypothetical protein